MPDDLLRLERDYWRDKALDWERRCSMERVKALDDAARLVARRMAGWDGDALGYGLDELQGVWEALVKLRGKVFSG